MISYAKTGIMAGRGLHEIIKHAVMIAFYDRHIFSSAHKLHDKFNHPAAFRPAIGKVPDENDFCL